MERDGNNSSGQQEDLTEKLNKLSPEAQQLISIFSSSFLEGDVREEYLRNPAKLALLREKLHEFGLDQQAVDVAMGVFGFPINSENNPPQGV